MLDRLLPAVVSAVIILCSCNRNSAGQEGMEYIDGLKSELSDTLSSGKENALAIATEMLDYSEHSKSDFVRLAALAYAGQTYMICDDYNTAVPLLEEGLELWYKLRDEGYRVKDYIPVFTIYNSLSIYAITCEMNYEKAIGLLTEGLLTTGKNVHPDDYAIMSFNLVFTYYLRNDPAGLPYALDLYNSGLSENNGKLIFIGAYSCSMMYLMLDEFDKAREYAETALSSKYLSMSYMGVYNIYATILASLGLDSEAERYYRLAWSYRDHETVTSVTNVCLSYGNFILRTGAVSEAINLYSQGIELNERYNNNVFTYKLYEAISRAYEINGDYKAALESYEQYKLMSDSLFNIKRERATASLTRKYEGAKHEAQLQRIRSILYLVGISAVAVLCISFVLWRLYRHKNLMYLSIVKLYKDAIRKEKGMEAQIDYLKKALSARGEKDNPAEQHVLSEEKADQLFMKIENLMQNEKIFTQSNITRDRLASIVGTNRTYLSKVINERTGMTFNQYLGSYRINCAVSILTDLSREVTVKEVSIDSGFCSVSTFCKQFKDEVGMTPTKYREKVVELSRMSASE